MPHICERRDKCRGIGGKIEETDYSEDVGVDDRIILKLFLKK